MHIIFSDNMASDVSEERMDPKKVFKQLLENFRKNLGSSGQDDGPCHWTAPRPFPSPDANINELSDINKDIINFYKQHVAGVKDFHIASSYVNFILQFLQCELQKQDIKCLQVLTFCVLFACMFIYYEIIILSSDRRFPSLWISQ